jgi:hypothetical protein
MPHILRDAAGKIVRVSTRTMGGSEVLPHNHPDVVEFLSSRGQDPKRVEESLSELRRTDNEMARAIEDVIMVLLKKNVFKMQDLPRAVQDRMNFRVRLRMTIDEIYETASGNKV